MTTPAFSAALSPRVIAHTAKKEQNPVAAQIAKVSMALYACSLRSRRSHFPRQDDIPCRVHRDLVPLGNLCQSRERGAMDAETNRLLGVMTEDHLVDPHLDDPPFLIPAD